MANHDNVFSINALRQQMTSVKVPPPDHLQSGDGGGTFDGMEARVKALETLSDRIDGKLDALIKDVAEIKGRVNAMPTTITLFGFVLAVLVLAGIAKFFVH